MAGLTGMTYNHKGSNDHVEEQQKHGGEQQASDERRSQDLSDWSRTQTNFRTMAGRWLDWVAVRDTWVVLKQANLWQREFEDGVTQ